MKHNDRGYIKDRGYIWLLLVVALFGCACAHAQSAEVTTNLKAYGDALISAQRAGRADVFSILGVLMAGLSLGGAGVYLLLKKQLANGILLIVEERQARNMIRVGLRAWDLSIIKKLGPEARLAALQSAIAHTRHAVDLILRLKIDTVVRGDLHALAATNLGYFLVTLAEQIKALHPSEDVSSFYCEALQLVNSVSVFVDSAARRRRTEDCEWWEVVESRLYVLFKASAAPDRNAFKQEIKKITDDMTIPSTARNEIWAIWEPLLKTEE